jgi:hypothetical protein
MHQVGNCMSACIASMIGIPLADVPNFCAEKDGSWSDRANAWLVQHGIQLLTFETDPVSWAPDYRRTVCIAGGKSPRGDWEHAVLWREGQLFWDPHPDGTGFVGEPIDYTVVVLVDPEAFDRRQKKT